MKTDRIIHQNSDGTSVIKETVVAVTKAEEVMCSMQTTVTAIHASAVSSYQTQLTNNQTTSALSLHDRVQYVEGRLKDTDSPFSDQTLWESLQAMSLQQCMEKEEGFLVHSLSSDPKSLAEVLTHLPPTSALAEMVRKVQEDVEVYIPYQVYSEAMNSPLVEEAVLRKGRSLHEGRLRHHLEDPVVQKREKQRLKRLHRDRVVDFGDRYMGVDFGDMDLQETHRRELASAKVATQLGLLDWRADRDLRFREDADESKEARMNTAVVLYDQFQDCLDSGRVMAEAWLEAWKPKICEHYLILQLLMGKAPPPEILVQSEVMEVIPCKELVESSFFQLDYAFHQSRLHTENVGDFSVLIPGTRRISSVVVEMSLLSRDWTPIFQRVVHSEVQRYKNDPAWAIMTPENLILRHLSRASQGTTESLDKLLAGRYADDGKTQAQLLEMVERVYVNHDPLVANQTENVHFARLSNLLPAGYRRQLDQGAQSQQKRLPPDLIKLMEARSGSGRQTTHS